jgi:hypothetical protein
MSTPIRTLGETVWELPPLILHPFNERVSPAVLLENSKAALMTAGLIPDEGIDRETLQRRVLSGRYSEVRMLFFLGKDVFRWIEQCIEWVEREPQLHGAELSGQSFAALLTADPPEAVKQKLLQWGVADYSAIFARAIGLNAMFVEPPTFDRLSAEFLRSYHRYADALYHCYMDLQPHMPIGNRNFQFQLYASGEYSRLLESSWSADQ